MPRTYKRAGSRNKWTDGQLESAMKAVRKDKMKPHKAATMFGIPSSTLYDPSRGKAVNALEATPQSSHMCRKKK